MKRNSWSLTWALLIALSCLFVPSLRAAAGESKSGERKAHGEHESGEKARYHSSIQVPDQDDDEQAGQLEGKRQGPEDENEQAEEAKLQSLAKISKQQAIAAAKRHTPGRLVRASLDNEDGNLVYSVEIRKGSKVLDVKVDAGNGKVLYVDRD